MPFNVYEQNICGRIPQGQDEEGRGGRVKRKKKKSNASTFRKGILRSEIFTRYFLHSSTVPFSFIFFNFTGGQDEFMLGPANESEKVTIKS